MTTAWLWCSIYLACLLVTGWGVCSLILPNRSRIDFAGLAACLGPGILSLILIAFSMVGWGPSRSILLSVAFVWGMLGIVAHRHRGAGFTANAPALPGSTFSKIWIILCLAAVGYGIFIVGRNALFQPVIEGDAFQIWQLKTKVLATVPLKPRPAYFSDVTLSYSHLKYPILVPMLSAGVHAMTGDLNDELGKAPDLLLYLGMGATVFGAVLEFNCWSAAFAAAALLLTIPNFLAYAGVGMADTALAAFYACAIVSILRWQAERRLADLVAALFSTICMAWTKNEGMALAIINVLAIFLLTPQPLKMRQIRLAVLFALVLGAAILPWIVYTRDLPATDEDYAGRLRVAQLIAAGNRIPTVAQSMPGEIVDWRRWGIFWIAVLALQLINWRRLRNRSIATLWFLLILQILAYFPPYMVTTWDLGELLRYSQSRLLLHAAPAAALIVGLQLPRDTPKPVQTD